MRWRHVFRTWLVAMTLLGAIGPRLSTVAAQSSATPVAAAPSASIDLAWVAILPSDLTQHGYGLTATRQRDADAYAVAIGGDDPTAFARRLEADGWRQGFSSTVALPSADDPDTFDRVVFATVSRYDDPTGASAALAAVRSQLIGAGHDPAPFAGSLGGEAALLRRQFTSQDTGRRAEVARLLMRDGDAIVDLTVLDWTNDAPAASEAVALARRLLTRLDEARTGGSPNLALGVSRIEGANAIPRLDAYLRRGNTSISLYRQSDRDLNADNALMEMSGVTDDVRYRVDLTDPARPADATGAYFVDLRRYDSIDHAMAAIIDTPIQQMQDLPADAHRIDLAHAGDDTAAIAFTTQRAGQPIRGYIGWTRVGDRVAEVDLWGPDVDQATYEQLIQRQAACMQSNRCWASTAGPAFDASAPGGATPVPEMW